VVGVLGVMAHWAMILLAASGCQVYDPAIWS
jgi:hypothetical protein